MYKINPDKPFKTIDEQIKILEKRNLIINDISSAKNALYNYSYYDLINGLDNYFFKTIKPPIFKDGITMEKLVNIQIVDKQLKNFILDQIIFVEKSLKTKMAYLVSKKFGVFDNNQSNEKSYLDLNNYSNSRAKMRYKTISTLKSIILSAKDSDYPNEKISKSLWHYAHNHNHVPPWILFNNITLGNIEYLYKVLKSSDKNIISKDMSYLYRNLFDTNINDENIKKIFIDSITFLRKYRNWIAHGNILSKFDAGTNNKSDAKNHIGLLRRTFPQNIFSMNDVRNGIPSNGIYILILLLIFLTNDIDQSKYFITNIIVSLSLLEKNEAQKNFKLPINFEQRLSFIYNKLITE